VGKKYRGLAVEAAVETWEISDWFTAEQLLPKVVECLPQRGMSVNVYAVSRFLRFMEAKGSLLSRMASSGVKEYSRIEGGDDNGSAYLYA
jgi:hypothetical protein